MEEIFSFFGFKKSYINQLLVLNNQISTHEGNMIQICVPKKLVDAYVYLARPGGYTYNQVIVQQDFDYTKFRHRKISGVLNMYKNNPHNIAHLMDGLQARILVCSDRLGLNPFMGVAIFRYTTVEPEKLKDYQEQLKVLTETIVEDRKSKGLWNADVFRTIWNKYAGGLW